MIKTEVLKKRAKLNYERQAKEIDYILDEIFYESALDTEVSNGYVVEIPYTRNGFDLSQSNSKNRALSNFDEAVRTPVIGEYIKKFKKLDGVATTEISEDFGRFIIRFTLS